jgi:hypothetical protein
MRADFIESYIAFVEMLRARNSDATFILKDYSEPELIPDLSAVVQILKLHSENHVLTFSPGTGFEQTGCD